MELSSVMGTKIAEHLWIAGYMRLFDKGFYEKMPELPFYVGGYASKMDYMQLETQTDLINKNVGWMQEQAAEIDFLEDFSKKVKEEKYKIAAMEVVERYSRWLINAICGDDKVLEGRLCTRENRVEMGKIVRIYRLKFHDIFTTYHGYAKERKKAGLEY